MRDIVVIDDGILACCLAKIIRFMELVCTSIDTHKYYNNNKNKYFYFVLQKKDGTIMAEVHTIVKGSEEMYLLHASKELIQTSAMVHPAPCLYRRDIKIARTPDAAAPEYLDDDVRSTAMFHRVLSLILTH